MAEITAKDVKSLRDATGAGMMDAKKALVEADGDRDRAARILREKGLTKVATLEDRENNQGAIAIARDGNRAALVELKSETDFSAKAPDFVAIVQRPVHLGGWEERIRGSAILEISPATRFDYRHIRVHHKVFGASHFFYPSAPRAVVAMGVADEQDLDVAEMEAELFDAVLDERNRAFEAAVNQDMSLP